ncbi:MAG TPA: hypothetical protein VGD69_00990 [Herpetosiphonaceae bacterium]
MRKTQFPQVQGCDLNDHEIVLPRDVDEDCVLVVISYKRWHQDFIDTWTSHLDQLTDQCQRLRIYYLSMFKPKRHFMQVIIAGYMKRFYTSKADQAAHILVYTDIDAFNRSLELPTTDTIYLLLIDRSGQVLWSGQNIFDQPQFDALSTTVELLLHDA